MLGAMAAALRTTVEDFVEGIKSFERELITKERLSAFLEAMRLSAEALRPYTYFHDEFYTRNLLYRDELFEVMAICWKPGQRTAVHTHNGQLGWMTIPQGEVAVHNFHYLRCDSPERQNVVGIDCVSGGGHVELERLGTLVCGEASPVATVDKIQTIHQIENSDQARSGCVSLHVYSLPFDSCVMFDMENHRCFRKSLRYFSRYGKIEAEEVERGPVVKK